MVHALLILIVPTLRVGMPCVTLCVTRTRSVRGCVTTRSVGTITNSQPATYPV